MKTVEVYGQGSFGGLAAGAALFIVFLVALFVAPWFTGPSFNDSVFAGLVTLFVAGVGYLFNHLFGAPLVQRPILRLGPEGISINALRVGAIPWSAIRRVVIREIPAHIASSTPTIKPRLIETWTDDDDSYLRRLPPARRFYARANQHLGAPLFRIYPDSLTMSAEDMIAAFRKCAPHASFEGLELVERETDGAS